MKTITTLAALLAATNVYSHSMSPIEFGGKDDPLNAITVTGYVVVPIAVGSDVKRDFLITVDGQEIDRMTVEAGQKKKAKIPVNLNKPNTVENHKVCSIGIGTSINTRICTRVKAYWLKEE